MSICKVMAAGVMAAALSVGAGQVQAQPSPVERFGQLESVWDAQISPDRSHLAVGCSPRGLREVCVYDLVGDARPQLIPAPDGARITSLYWASDNHLLIRFEQYERQDTGSRLSLIRYSRLLSWNRRTGGSAVLLNELGGSLSNLGHVESVLLDRDDAVAIEITLTVGDRAGTGALTRRSQDYQTVVQEVDLDTGESRDVIARSGSASILDYVMDRNGEILARVFFDNDSRVYQLRAGARGNRTLVEDRFEIDLPRIIGPVDSGQALAIRFPGGVGLRRVDLASGEITEFSEGVDSAGVILDPYTGELLGFRGISRQNLLPVQDFTFDPELDGLLEDFRGVLPDQSVTIRSWTPDRRNLVVVGGNPGRPTSYYMFDRTSNQLNPIGTGFDAVADSALPERTSISYIARDGLEIPAILTLPAGHETSRGRLPLVLMPHGGPRSRDTLEFDWQAAALAEAGYAVLQPNFRGSTGYGYEFEAAGFGEFGRGMITDMIDGARHLAETGIASERYCAVGGSYGGYASLMLALDDAANIDCAVAFAPVTHPMGHIATGRNFDSFVDYWERYMGSRFSSPADIAAQSPRERAATLTRPVLLLHGEEDMQVELIQSEWFFEAATATGNVEFLRLEGEDHFMGSTAVRSRFLDEVLGFLDRHHSDR